MTHPQQGRGAPPLEHIAQEVLGEVAGRQRRAQLPPAAVPLSEAEKAEADKVADAKNLCSFCLGLHPLPNSPGCPRLASFELDGDGKVKAGTFFPGRRWSKGRVVLFEDTKEDDDDDDQ